MILCVFTLIAFKLLTSASVRLICSSSGSSSAMTWSTASASAGAFASPGGVGTARGLPHAWHSLRVVKHFASPQWPHVQYFLAAAAVRAAGWVAAFKSASSLVIRWSFRFRASVKVRLPAAAPPLPAAVCGPLPLPPPPLPLPFPRAALAEDAPPHGIVAHTRHTLKKQCDRWLSHHLEGTHKGEEGCCCHASGIRHSSKP